jgi:hypothetical protein
MHKHHAAGAAAVRGVLAGGLIAALALGACGGAAPVAATAAPATAAPTAAATTAAPAASPAAATVTVKGTISKLEDSGKSVTVKTTDGKEIVFEVSSSRTTLKDERPGGTVKSRTDLKVGMLVTVVGPAAGGEAVSFTVTG